MEPAIWSVDMIGQLQSLMRALEAGMYNFEFNCPCQSARPDDWESHSLFCTGVREQMQGLSQYVGGESLVVESLETVLSKT
jgi:hypothetical protein